MPTDVYTHIAATFDGTTAKLYVNGVPCGSAALPFTPVTGVDTLIGKDVTGGTDELFEGDLDELRIWNRVRSDTELKEQLNHRLIGNEAGLVAYYRFDEGDGSTVYDQTDRALHGTLEGDVRWTGSDAPVGDHPGVRRDSFALKGRTVVSGMSALLYHQQENVVAGYRADPKPAKRQARVMLAFAAKYGQDPAVVTLDFAVGRDGRLAQAPDVLDPAVLKQPTKGTDSEQVSSLQQLIKRLEPEIADLQSKIGQLSGVAGLLAERQAEHDRLKPAFDDLERRYFAEKDLLTSWNYNIELKNPKVLGGNTFRSVHSIDSAGGGPSVIVTPDVRSSWRVEPVGQSQDGRPCYWVVNNRSGQDLHVMGNSMSENTQLNVITREPANPAAQFQLVTEGEFVRLVNRGSRLAIGVPATSQQILVVQAKECLTAETGLLRMVRAGMRSGLDVTYPTAKAQMDAARELLQEARTAKQRVDELTLTLAAKQVELKDAQNKLANLSTALQGDDDLTVAMPLLAVDTTGLSLSGGLLEFARGTDRPALLDSGTGNVVLYFRGANDQFFAAYYDTAVIRGTQSLAGRGGTLGFLARDPGIALGSCTIKISDGDAPGRCDLTITLGNETETWRSLPRKADQMAAALAGNPGRPVTVGAVARVTGSTVELTGATTAVVPAKAHLTIGSNGYAVDADTPIGSKTLTLTTSATAVKPGDKISLVGYDWARAESTRPGVLLSAGSRLVGLSAGDVDSVPNGTAKPTITGRGCRWRAEMPGRAFLFDGKEQYLSLPAGKQQDIAPSGDLTMGAWVNPESGQGRIIHARTDTSGYSLALAPVGLPVKQFIGDTKVELTGALDLAGRDFTVELWAKRNQARGRREPLLTHGAMDGRVDQTLHLCFEPDDTFMFALYGDAVKTAQPYPDLEWHHWAAVNKNATRELILYRDGPRHLHGALHRQRAAGARLPALHQPLPRRTDRRGPRLRTGAHRPGDLRPALPAPVRPGARPPRPLGLRRAEHLGLTDQGIPGGGTGRRPRAEVGGALPVPRVGAPRRDLHPVLGAAPGRWRGPGGGPAERAGRPGGPHHRGVRPGRQARQADGPARQGSGRRRRPRRRPLPAGPHRRRPGGVRLRRGGREGRPLHLRARRGARGLHPGHRRAGAPQARGRRGPGGRRPPAGAGHPLLPRRRVGRKPRVPGPRRAVERPGGGDRSRDERRAVRGQAVERRAPGRPARAADHRARQGAAGALAVQREHRQRHLRRLRFLPGQAPGRPLDP